MKHFNFVTICISVIFCLCGCVNKYAEITPAIVPEIPTEPVKNNHCLTRDGLKIIGATEPVYIDSIKKPFYARIDTGAETSSLDAKNIKKFERDGEKWVSFDLIQRSTGIKQHFEIKRKRRTAVRRAEEFEHRMVVEMQVKFDNETFVAEFSLVDRNDFDYQVLIGRNILMGKFAVDVAVANTLQ